MRVTRAWPGGIGLLLSGLFMGVALPARAADLDQMWWVVLGSYRHVDLAERRQAELEGRMLDVLSLVRSDRDGVPLFRIVAGPFADLEAARGAAAQAADAGIADAWVTHLRADAYRSMGSGRDALAPLDGPLDSASGGDMDDSDARSLVPLDFNEDLETGFNRLFREGMDH